MIVFRDFTKNGIGGLLTSVSFPVFWNPLPRFAEKVSFGFVVYSAGGGGSKPEDRNLILETLSL
jgi:hypothetical protein